MDVRDGFIDTIGKTPLIKLKRVSEETGCTILGKAEFLNPGGSIKDRAALAIVKDAEAKGQLKPGGVIVEGTAEPGSQNEDAVQQVIKYYGDVGVKATYKFFERSLYTEHFQANEIEAAWWGGDRTVLPIVAPWIFIGTMLDRPWGAAWTLWKNSNGTDPNGEEPPQGHWIWDIWDTWDKISVEPDSAKQNALFRQILDIWARELPMVGYLGESPSLIIDKNGVRNYLPGFPMDDTTGDEHLLNTETYYWDDPSKSAA